jgi:(+)-pinoresinol hydroxylase
MNYRSVMLLLMGGVGLILAPAAAADGPQTSSATPSSWSRVANPAGAAPADPVARRGREVFHARCQACHGPIPQNSKPALFNLPAMPGTWALQAKYRGTIPALLEERTDLTPEFVSYVVRRGAGFMPFFRPTEISDDDLKALSAWLTRKPG